MGDVMHIPSFLTGVDHSDFHWQGRGFFRTGSLFQLWRETQEGWGERAASKGPPKGHWTGRHLDKLELASEANMHMSVDVGAETTLQPPPDA